MPKIQAKLALILTKNDVISKEKQTNRANHGTVVKGGATT